MAKKKTKKKIKKTAKPAKPARTKRRAASKAKPARAKAPASSRKKVTKKSPAKPRAVRAASAASAPSSPPPPPGSFVWFELMSPDVNRAKRFYTQLFGWKTSEMEMMPGFNYTMFENRKQSIAGMMPITAEHGDMKPHWDLYISVRDVDAIAQQCEALGGEIIIPPHDIPVGRWAMLQDPTGAKVAIYKAKKR
jgi:predicted enzyme related to lactoylglutathione lyase